MREWTFAFALLLGFLPAAGAAPQPAPLTTLSAIHALTNGQGNRGYLVTVEATVTFFRSDEHLLFVQDGTEAVCVVATTNTELLPGDRVLVKGTTSGSYNPIVISNDIIVLRHGILPGAVPATFRQLVKGDFDCRLVTVHGVIRAADLEAKQPWMRKTFGEIKFNTVAGPVWVYIETGDLSTLRKLLDATVEITGVSGGIFDDKMQLTGTALYVPRLSNIRVLDRPKVSPWLAPVTQLDKILCVYDMHDLTPRIRVQGIITYYQPGHAIVLQNGLKSLWIETVTNEPLRIGDRAEAIGFTDAHDRFMSLIDAEISDSHVYVPITPRPATWEQLASWSSTVPDGHQNDLVSISGRVVEAVREATRDEFVIDSGAGLFTAIYHHPPPPSVLPPMADLPLGSRIRVIGICSRTDTKSAIPGQEVPFDILMRSLNDVALIAKPPLVNTENLIRAVSLLLLVVIAVGAWGWTLRKKVGQQTVALASMAAFEKRRSHILEKINGFDPLPAILTEISKLISSMLDGTSCWCRLADGTVYGTHLPDLDEHRFIQAAIAGGSGTVLGHLCACLDRHATRSERETEALCVGVRLAALAIETRKLYSDLHHRSEFDLLTDIPNRFSLSKRLEVQIGQASQNATGVGLIYIDLDKFKPINDTYGHRVGDLFLQAVALRMSRQLPSGDMLARLGGDEFAALVAIRNGRSDLDTILTRLQRCFDDPFVMDGHALLGEASFGTALYPEDGLTSDSLLSAADAAMYRAKKARRQAAAGSRTSAATP